MAMAAMMKRAVQHTCRGIRRGYSDSRMLSEEEKAAENMYIKKMEQERMEKLRKAAEQAQSESKGETGATTTAADGTPRTAEEAAAVRNKGIALGAGIGAVLCGLYWIVSTPPDKKQKKIED